jgi:hypothetical protein
MFDIGKPSWGNVAAFLAGNRAQILLIIISPLPVEVTDVRVNLVTLTRHQMVESSAGCGERAKAKVLTVGVFT